MEIKVQQRSSEWLELRGCVCVTASRFADAVGAGMGKPYDFLASLLSTSPHKNQEDNAHVRHGVALEPLISEAYGLLTGYQIRDSGFWLPCSNDSLQDLVGASPDGIVYTSIRDESTSQPIGLAEFKAPVYAMYHSELHGGIPRHYMVQVQGQMAVCGFKWCDFMAVCTKTQDIMLKRVHFQSLYWNYISSRLKSFCSILKEARLRIIKDLEPLNFKEAVHLKMTQSPNEFPGERNISVQNLLKTSSSKKFRGPSGIWMSYDFLMGNETKLSPDIEQYGKHLLQTVDIEILNK